MHVVNFTVSLPDSLKHKMADFGYVNWSAAIRGFIERKISDFEIAERIASKSKFTDKDFEQLMAKVDEDFKNEGRRLLNEARGRR